MTDEADVIDERGRKRVSTWLHETPDGRVWRVDDFGPGKVRATWLMSPTGYYEWVDWPNPNKPQPAV